MNKILSLHSHMFFISLFIYLFIFLDKSSNFSTNLQKVCFEYGNSIMKLSLQKVYIAQIIFQLSMNESCFIDIKNIFHTKLFTHSKLTRQNNLLVNLGYGTLRLTENGYLTINICQYIILFIYQISQLYRSIIKKIWKYIYFGTNDRKTFNLKVTNVNVQGQIENYKKIILLKKLVEKYKDIIKIERKTSACSETSFLSWNFSVEDFNFRFYYKIRIDGATIKINPSGMISIITRSYSQLHNILEIIISIH